MTELQNFDYCQETLLLKSTIESSFLDLAARLMKIRNERLYEPQWTSFAEYCMEMKMKESVASRLINILERFVIGFGATYEDIVKIGGWSMAAELLPVIKTEEDLKHWFGKAELLSRDDIRRDKKEALTGILQTECQHPNAYKLVICPDCGERHKLYEEERV